MGDNEKKKKKKRKVVTELRTQHAIFMFQTPLLFHAYLLRERTRRYFSSSNNNYGKPNRS